MNQIERFLATLRATHPGFEQLYLQGHCYRLFVTLRSIWPAAEPWYSMIEGHVYTRIGRHWYDIRGKHVRIPPDATVLDHARGDAPHRWTTRSGWDIAATRTTRLESP